jgi:hypothetical protein
MLPNSTDRDMLMFQQTECRFSIDLLVRFKGKVACLSVTWL